MQTHSSAEGLYLERSLIRFSNLNDLFVSAGDISGRNRSRTITYVIEHELHLLFAFQMFFSSIEADWGSPQSGQYHIQTDEGPERFFRYQTDSGQFRNEKRLRDGTVIGILYSELFRRD